MNDSFGRLSPRASLHHLHSHHCTVFPSNFGFFWGAANVAYRRSARRSRQRIWLTAICLQLETPIGRTLLRNSRHSPFLQSRFGESRDAAICIRRTAHWGDIVENSKAFHALKPVVQAHLKNAVEEVFKREVNLQRARIQRQINLRLAEMPEHRRRFAQVALEKVMKRFYGESEEKVETVASVILDAFEKDEYWLVLKQIDESKGGDVETFASALEVFGLLDMALMANQAKSRLKVLDHLDDLVRNAATLEKNVHSVIERNLWVLGYDHSLISSNKTLARTIEEYTTAKFTGSRASKRPDLFLAQNLRGGHLLIEFKRPAKAIDRQDQRQAQEYRDDLESKFGQIEILLLGKGRDVTASVQNDPPRLQVYGYEALISAARTQLDWLLNELNTDDSSAPKTP